MSGDAIHVLVSAPVAVVTIDRPDVKNAFDDAAAAELVAAFDGQLNPGVVTDTFGDGKDLKRKYGFSHFPALVFVRGGEYVGAISRMQDWAHYLDQISDLLVAPPRRAPGFSIPVVTEGNA